MWESEGGRGGDASAARAGERPCSGLGAGREWARAVGCAEGGNGRVDGGSRMRCPGASPLLDECRQALQQHGHDGAVQVGSDRRRLQVHLVLHRHRRLLRGLALGRTRPHQRFRATRSDLGQGSGARCVAGAGWLARLIGVIVAGARLGRLGLAWLLLHGDLLVRHTRLDLRGRGQRERLGAGRRCSTHARGALSPPSSLAACVGRSARCACGGLGLAARANGWAAHTPK